jgi:lipopolysaccharide export system permease protein
MKILDRFVIKRFLGPFFLTFFIVIFVLSMQFLWIYIDELVGKGLGIGVILEFMAWAAATLIPMSLPLATLLASIMSLGGMGEHNELLAMKAAGISLGRILIPVIILSAVISVGAFFAANDLVPVSYNKIYTLRNDILHTKDEIKIPKGIFYDGIDNYIIRIEDRNDETGMMYDVIIYDHTYNTGNTNITIADSGKMVVTSNKQHLIFNLYHGISYQEDNKMTYRDTTITLNKLKFEEQQLIVALEDYTFTRSTDDRFGDEVMSKDLKQLRHDRDSLSIVFDQLQQTQQNRFLSGSGMTFLYQLDSAKQADFVGWLDIDSLYTMVASGDPIQREKEACRQAMDKLTLAIDQVENFSRENYRYVDPIKRIDIESHRKFTLSLACLLFFFIGAPLGAIIRKGGLGTPVVVSIFFYLVYYIIDISGKKLAKDGVMTPFVGTIISSVVLLPIGIFLTRHAIRDSNLFNIDSYKLFFKNIWDYIVKIYHKVRNFFRKDRGRIRIIYLGTPEFAVGPLESLLEAGFEVVAVVTAPDKPSGRGLKINESAVKKCAIKHNIPVLQPEKLKDPEFLEQLASFNANLFVVVAFRMLPVEVWSMPALGTFNLHASLLPQYRGAAPINWVLINGERITGVTTFLLNEEIDTGKILFQESCLIEEYDNAGSLHDKLMEMGSALVVKTASAIRDRTVRPVAQDTQYMALRPAPKLSRGLTRIDWSKDARDIVNLIRGLSPYPCAHTTFTFEEQQPGVKIFEAFVRDKDNKNEDWGTITSDGSSWLEIKCGTGSVRLLNLQLAGKRRLDIVEFLKGFREPEKYRAK